MRVFIFLECADMYRPHPWEHLMIMFYDVLLIDDDVVVHRPYEQRRKLLKRLINRRIGIADFAWRKAIDFSRPEGAIVFQKLLADVFARRWEGLVLKPSQSTYFGSGRVFSTSGVTWIKIKKDCIKGLGDTMDFAVVGGGFDVNEVVRSKLPGITLTHFFLACIQNKEEIVDRSHKPKILVFDCVHACIKKEDLRTINQLAKFRGFDSRSPKVKDLFDLKYTGISSGFPQMTTIFREPFVFEIAGSGFDKSQNRGFWALRFPRVTKIHWDRDWRNATSLGELQQAAHQACAVPRDDLRSEIARWRNGLKHVEQKHAEGRTVWDLTDNEDDQDKKHSGKPNRRSEGVATTRVTQPMIRMDSAEMRADERRLDDGSIARVEPSSEQPPRGQNQDSFSTSPASSFAESSRKGDPSTKLKSSYRLETPPRKRRRIMGTENSGVAGISLNTKPSPHPDLNPPSTSTIKPPKTIPTALDEVINYSSPSPSRASQSSKKKSQESTQADRSPFLVRKVAIGAHDADYWKYRKRNRIMAAGSSPRVWSSQDKMDRD